MTLTRVHFIEDLNQGGERSTGNHAYSLIDKNANVSAADIINLHTSGYLNGISDLQLHLESTLQIPDFVSGTIISNTVFSSENLNLKINGIDLNVPTLTYGSAKHHFCKTFTEAEKKQVWYDRRQNYDIQVLSLSGSLQLYALELWYSGGYIDNNWGSGTQTETIPTSRIYSTYAYDNVSTIQTRLFWPDEYNWYPYSGNGRFGTNQTSLQQPLRSYFYNYLNDSNDNNRYVYNRVIENNYPAPSFMTMVNADNLRLGFESQLPPFTYISKPTLNLRYRYNTNGYGWAGNGKYTANQCQLQVFGSHSGMHGTHLVGVGSILPVSTGTFNTTINLGFIDPINHSGQLHHFNNVHTSEAFRDLELIITGIPSGFELIESSLTLAYNSGINLYSPFYSIGGNIERKTATIALSGANGYMYWQGNYDFTGMYNSGFYQMNELQGNKITSLNGLYSGVNQTQAGVPANLTWIDFTKRGTVDSYNDSVAFHRNAIFLGHNNNAQYLNFNNILGSGDFSLFMHIAQSGITIPQGMVLNKGNSTATEFNVFVDSLGKLNYYVYDTSDTPYGGSFDFHGSSIGLLALSYQQGSGLQAWYGAGQEYPTLYSRFHHFSSARKLAGSSAKLTVGGYEPYASSSHPLNSDGYSFPGYLCQLGFAGSSITSRQVSDQFDAYAGFNQYLSSGDNKYIELRSASGSITNPFQSVSQTSYRPIQFNCGTISKHIDWFDAPDYTAYGTIPVASSVYIEIDCEHTTNHPSGIYVAFHIDTPIYQDVICDGVIPSGGRKTLFLAPKKWTLPNQNDKPRFSQPTKATLYAYYNSLVSYDSSDNLYKYNDNFYGDFKVYSTQLLVDGWGAADTGTNNIPLYTSGAYISTNSLDLYTFGAYKSSGNIDLYTQGYISSSSTIPLFTMGGVVSTSSIPLYTNGIGFGSSTMPLYLFGGTTTRNSGSIPMFMWSSTNSGVYTCTPLFAYSNLDPVNSLPIYSLGGSNPLVNGTMNLYLYNDNSTHASLDLYVHNNWSLASGTLTLYLEAPSGTLGAVPASSTVPLYVGRDYDSLSHCLALFTSGPLNNSGILSMYTYGGYSGVNDSMSLYTFGHGVSTDRTLKLYVNGY